MKKLILLSLLMVLATLTFAQAKNNNYVVTKAVKQDKTAKVEIEEKINSQLQAITLQDSYLESFANESGFIFKGTKENYIVIKADGYSQKELYNKLLLSLNNNYVDIDKVVTKIEYDALTINAKMLFDESKTVTTNPYFFKGNILFVFTSIDYRLSFKFKDGKIRVDLPYIKSGIAGTLMPDRNFSFQNSEMTEDIYKGMSKYFDSLLVKILKGAYQSTDNDW